MKFEETFTIAHPVDQAWAFFEDANRLARCVPGVESVEPGEGGRSRLRMTQTVGYMSATFDLRMHVSESRPNELLEITSVGKTVRGAAGEMRSVNRVELTDEDGKTGVRLASDVAVGGMLGSVGNKAMEAKAREVATAFAANVNREVDAFSASKGGGDGDGAHSAPAAPAPAQPPAKPAGWGSQIVGLIRTVIAWLFRRTRRV
jgi:carbon monoxide dehydrogenase subunit G